MDLPNLHSNKQEGSEGSLISLLAESSSDNNEHESDPLNLYNNGETQGKAFKVVRSSLTKLQEEIIHAIESINIHYFVDLGGVNYYDINFESKNGFPLKIAACKGSEHFVRLMLENKMIDINKKDKDGLNAFWVACRYGHGNVMRCLAEKGVDILNTDRRSYNVLHVAAKHMYNNIIEMLVRSKFPLDLKTDNGDTAVAIAAQKGNLSALKILAKAGANLNVLNNHSLSSLYLATLNNQKDCAEFLLEEGAWSFVNGSDLEKDRSPIFLAIRTENTELLEMMFDYESQMAVKNSDGLTPLMYAAKHGYNQIVNFLTQRTNDLNEEDANSLTILMHRLIERDFKMARKLMNRGADINYVNRNGFTPL